MDKTTLNQIIRQFPKQRVLFHYFKDKYALDLLSYYVGEGKPIREVKQSQFKGLLQKPLLKDVVSELGDGTLTQDILRSVWPVQPQVYVLTLGKWGEEGIWHQFYNQTSRPGKNLVLQLNFSNQHDVPYKKVIHQVDRERRPFEYEEHPISKKRNTLAWARIDFSNNKEALIEEVQTDWIRFAQEETTTIEEMDEKGNVIQKRYSSLGLNANRLDRYVRNVLKPHIRLWDEAVLSAAIWYLKEQLQMERIFYHTFDTGNKLKQIVSPWMRYTELPPKSLYTKLPKRFCFQETTEVPKILQEEKKYRKKSGRKKYKKSKKRDWKFYLLEV